MLLDILANSSIVRVSPRLWGSIPDILRIFSIISLSHSFSSPVVRLFKRIFLLFAKAPLTTRKNNSLSQTLRPVPLFQDNYCWVYLGPGYKHTGRYYVSHYYWGGYIVGAKLAATLNSWPNSLSVSSFKSNFSISP